MTPSDCHYLSQCSLKTFGIIVFLTNNPVIWVCNTCPNAQRLHRIFSSSFPQITLGYKCSNEPSIVYFEIINWLCFSWKAWLCDVMFLFSVLFIPLLFHRRHVFYLQHYLNGRFPHNVTQLSPGDSPGGTLSDLHHIPAGPRTSQAMEVDGLSDCSKQGYSQETKRLKRTPAPDSLGLEMEHRFIDQVLSTCRNVEQARFANAYRKWLDTLSQWKRWTIPARFPF